MPIPSNVGEPEVFNPFLERRNEAVVFGLKPTREQLYRKHEREITKFCIDHGVETIHDIGQRLQYTGGSEISRRLRSHGHVAAAAISAVMSTARYQFIDYPAGFITKSGALAAGLAHGMAIVNFSPGPASDECAWQRPEWKGFHDESQSSALATRAFHAYRSRNWRQTAQLVLTALKA